MRLQIEGLRNRGSPRIPIFEILPSYRTHLRQLQQSNPRIRRKLGFFSRALTAQSLCVASNAPNRPRKRRKMSGLQAVLRHVWPVFSYLNESVPLVLATIEHPQYFVISPKMYSSLHQRRDVILQISNVSAGARHCLIEKASAPHRVCYLFWPCVCRAVQSPNYQAACVFLRL